MIRIVADHQIPFLENYRSPDVHWRCVPGHEITRALLMDADALLVRTRTQCNRALLDGTPVRFIGTATAGFDHIDTDFTAARGIRFIHAPGSNSGAVAQYIGSALAFLFRKEGMDFRTATLGVIGAGHIGKKVIAIGKALGMRVLVNDPPRERTEGTTGFVGIDRLLMEADVISVHVPLQLNGSDPTHYLLNRENLKGVNPTAWIINTSRGGVVEETALVSAIRGKKLAGCIVDVWENEPVISRDLLGISRLATPHIAGYSLDGKFNATRMIMEDLTRFFSVRWGSENLPESLGREKHGLNLPSEEDNAISLADLFIQTYAIETDDRMFRRDPKSFERIRKNYSWRREWGAFEIKSGSGNAGLIGTLRKLGFGIRLPG